MQSIEDEIPDLSGPVSLGTYKFTRRGRGKKYETHELSELQEMQDEKREGETKVTEVTTTSSNPPTFTPPPPTTTTFSSSQLSHPPAQHHKDVEVKDAQIKDSTLDSFNDRSSDRRTFPEPSPPQYDKTDQSHFATQFSSAISSIYTDKKGAQAPGQAYPTYPPGQDCASNQKFYALINPDTSSSQTTGSHQVSCPPENLSSNQPLSATVRGNQQSLHPASGQADSPFTQQDHSSDQNLNAPIGIDRPLLQASTEADHLFSVTDYQAKPLQRYHQLARSLDDLIKKDRRNSNVSGPATFPFPPQDFQLSDSQSHKTTNFLVTQEQGSPPLTQVYRPASSETYSSTISLPLPDTLQTATFNIETKQWDPDSPKDIMAARTPASNSIRGGHSGGPSSRQSLGHMSQGSKEIGIPHAIVTTTKAGRPYTNPYSPIDPRISAARPTVKESPSGHTILEPQNHGTNTFLQRQENLRYIGQEQAHYGLSEQDIYGHPEESLDDPFQDYPKPAHQTRRIQSSNYAEHAAQQAAYGESSNYGHQQPASTYTSLSNASPYVPNARQALQDPHSGISPNQGQRSVFEQHSIVDPRTRNAGTAALEQHSAYEQRSVINPRASVRLPAVRGTSTQQSVILPERKYEGLFVEESIAKKNQEQGRRPVESAVQPNPGKLSHAIPIRDPAAYTGAGLTTRRNQEALRQNFDTIIASSQGMTGSARTVMNDPHQARRPSSTATDATITESTLRAQAPSYESVPGQLSATATSASMMPTQMTTHPKKTLQGELQPVRGNAGNALRGHERAAANSEPMYLRESCRAPAIPPGFHRDASAYTESSRLPAEAIGAGNAFMNQVTREVPNKKTPQQSQEDAVKWFRHDSRDLSHAAAILPRELMNKINPEQFPLEDTSRRTVGQLANDSQDDDPDDRARQVATPRPIGHGRPAGFVTPPSTHGPRQARSQAPFSTLTGVTSVNDTEGMRRSGRKFLDDDAQAIERMMAGVFSNLMTAKNGPYDYTNHYAPPPAYAIDHNVRNNHTFFDPQWFATAPPARVGRDPRREQGEYEDPTQGSAGRRGDHVRADFGRHDSGGRGCGGGRGWGRI